MVRKTVAKTAEMLPIVEYYLLHVSSLFHPWLLLSDSAAASFGKFPVI
jgi:hypothetical protein